VRRQWEDVDPQSRLDHRRTRSLGPKLERIQILLTPRAVAILDARRVAMAPDGRMSRGRFIEWLLTKGKDVRDAHHAYTEAREKLREAIEHD
jgi:hypothetical protein